MSMSPIHKERIIMMIIIDDHKNKKNCIGYEFKLVEYTDSKITQCLNNEFVIEVNKVKTCRFLTKNNLTTGHNYWIKSREAAPLKVCILKTLQIREQYLIIGTILDSNP